MRTSVLVAVATLSSLDPIAADAQRLSPRLREDLARFSLKEGTSWTSQDFDAFERVLLAVSREMVDSGLSPSERERLQKYSIQVANEEGGPPAWVSEGNLWISRHALGESVLIGMYIGRDVYTEIDGAFPIPDSLLAHPYRYRAILPLIPSLRNLGLWRPPFGAIKCDRTQTLCAEPQAAAIFAGVVGFLVAHEVAHVLLNHGDAPENGRTDDEELAADSKAWSVLMRVAPSPSLNEKSMEFRVRSAIAAGPLLLLRWLRDQVEDSPDATYALEERFDALRSKLDESIDYFVGAIVDPKTVSGRLRSITIHWPVEPDELFINGVTVAPGEVAARSVSVFGDVQVLARSGSQFAYAEVDSTRSPAEVALYLEFQPLSADSPTTTELRRLEEQRNWYELFRRTATASMAPESNRNARWFYTALRRLQLPIREIPDSLAPEDRRHAEWLKRRSEPLGDWQD